MLKVTFWCPMKSSLLENPVSNNDKYSKELPWSNDIYSKVSIVGWAVWVDIEIEDMP